MKGVATLGQHDDLFGPAPVAAKPAKPLATKQHRRDADDSALPRMCTNSEITAAGMLLGRLELRK